MLSFLNDNLVLMVAAAVFIGLTIAVMALLLFISDMGWQLAFMLLLLGMIAAPIIFSVSRLYRH